MKCNLSLVFAAAAFLAIGTDAAIVKECTHSGQVSLVIDGITSNTSSDIIHALESSNVKATITLTGSESDELFSKVTSAGHTVAYRATFGEGTIVSNLTEEEIASTLNEAKHNFDVNHQIQLRYVVFPTAKDQVEEEKFAAAAEQAGLTAIGHSLYLGHQAKHTLAHELHDSKHNSYIALLEMNTPNLQDVLKHYRQRMMKKNFKAVPLETCLADNNMKAGGVVGRNLIVKRPGVFKSKIHSKKHPSKATKKQEKKERKEAKKIAKKEKKEQKKASLRNKGTGKHGGIVPKELVVGFNGSNSSPSKSQASKPQQVTEQTPNVVDSAPVKMASKQFTEEPTPIHLNKQPKKVNSKQEGDNGESNKVSQNSTPNDNAAGSSKVTPPQKEGVKKENVNAGFSIKQSSAGAIVFALATGFLAFL